MLGIEHVFEADFLASMRGHAAHVADDARFDAALDFSVRLGIANGFEQAVPFVQIRIGFVLFDFWIPEETSDFWLLVLAGAGRQSPAPAFGSNGATLGAMRH